MQLLIFTGMVVGIALILPVLMALMMQHPNRPSASMHTAADDGESDGENSHETTSTSSAGRSNSYSVLSIVTGMALADGLTRSMHHTDDDTSGGDESGE
jgi:hypothetical protein